MNIKTRLKKLEGEVIIEESGFCSCAGPVKFLLPGIVPGHTEAAAEISCRGCGKLKGEVKHFTFKFNSNAPLMEEA